MTKQKQTKKSTAIRVHIDTLNILKTNWEKYNKQQSVPVAFIDFTDAALQLSKQLLKVSKKIEVDAALLFSKQLLKKKHSEHQ